MTLEDELFRLEEGFWLDGRAYFLAHLDAECLLAFPQAGEMHGVRAAERIAETASTPGRWRDLRISARHLLQPTRDFAVISYRADVVRFDGVPYAALIGSGYALRADGWKLAFHQHSPVGAN
jgi:hypothetical protein